MFTIESLWKIERLSPLQKAHEVNPQDRRLVVVADSTQLGGVHIAETEALHTWLESQGYQYIPDTWETVDLNQLEVVHISKLTIQIMRRNPFSWKPAPLAPNSWLAQLSQDRFDALLLAQQSGDVPWEPTILYVKDSLRPQLTAPDLSLFWTDTVADVKFAQSGDAPRNERQKQVLANWEKVLKRRHYDPTDVAPPFPGPSSVQADQHVECRVYAWDGANGSGTWNARLTELRNWITDRTRNTGEIQNIAMQVFGTFAYIQLTGQIRNDAHSLVREAALRRKLDELATIYDFVQDSNDGSAFNQAGQTVTGSQLNVTVGAGSRGVAIGSNVTQTVINTGGRAFIGGNVVVGGDFVGGDMIIGDKIVKK